MTALMEDAKSGELLRRDYSLTAWGEVEPTLGPAFSVWRSEYEAAKSEGRPEIAEKESGENLLRRLCEEDAITTENTRYILAVMLERKKQLKQTGTRETEDATFLVYEHVKSGEVYIIRDPELKLAQIEEVQQEVSRLLAGGNEAAASVEQATASLPVTESDEKDRTDGSPEAEIVADQVPEQESSSEGVTSEEISGPEK